MHRSPNLPGWERRGLLDELVTLLGSNGSTVIVENDANLCAVGEHARGAAQGVDVVACLTVGTGIGMGILVDGRLFRGAHGAAGEDRRSALRPGSGGGDDPPAGSGGSRGGR